MCEMDKETFYAVNYHGWFNLCHSSTAGATSIGLDLHLYKLGIHRFINDGLEQHSLAAPGPVWLWA